MAQLQQPLDTTNIDTSDDFPNLPEGWYKAIISASDESANDKGTGRFIRLEFTLENGRTIKTWLNYIHSNPKAQSIAEKQLAQILEYTDTKPPLVDTQQLHNKVLDIYIATDGTYDTVKKYRARTDKKADAITPQDLRTPAPTFADLEDDDAGTPDWAK